MLGSGHRTPGLAAKLFPRVTHAGRPSPESFDDHPPCTRAPEEYRPLRGSSDTVACPRLGGFSPKPRPGLERIAGGRLISDSCPSLVYPTIKSIAAYPCIVAGQPTHSTGRQVYLGIQRFLKGILSGHSPSALY